MNRFLFLVMVVSMTGCVQNQNSIPDDHSTPDDQSSVFDPRVEAISRDILAFAKASDRDSLRKYAAMYQATSDALDQSPQDANTIVCAAQAAHAEFVTSRIEGMANVARKWLPPTSNPQSNRAEISQGFRALSLGCLKASSQVR